MRERGDEAKGFSLIEVVIAMVLLGIIAIALLPALWQGIQLSSGQSAAATATRHLNSIVESGREAADCTSLVALITSPPSVQDGSGGAIIVSASLRDSAGVAVDQVRCDSATPPRNVTLSLALSARDAGGDLLAQATALILVQ